MVSGLYRYVGTEYMGFSLASVLRTSSRLLFSSRRRSAPTSPSSESVSMRSYQRSRRLPSSSRSRSRSRRCSVVFCRMSRIGL